jgi:hypothetical protein
MVWSYCAKELRPNAAVGGAPENRERKVIHHHSFVQEIPQEPFRRKGNAKDLQRRTVDFGILGRAIPQEPTAPSVFVPSCLCVSPFPGSEFLCARLHDERPGLIARFHNRLTQRHKGTKKKPRALPIVNPIRRFSGCAVNAGNQNLIWP